MRVKYILSAQSREFDVSDSSDLSEICSEIESRLRAENPGLAEQPFLTERIADSLLNSLAVDGTQVDLGDLSSQKNKLCPRKSD
jgi:hypothetical protein